MIPSKPQILTVNRNPRNLELLTHFLGKEGYEVASISSLEALAQSLDQADHFGIALVDISGFDRSIWAYCEKLADAGVPLLVIAPQQLASIRQESLSHGAQNVLFKPLVIQELASVIRSMFRGDTHE